MFTSIPSPATQYALSNVSFSCSLNTLFPKAITSPLNLDTFSTYDDTSSFIFSSSTILLIKPQWQAYFAVIDSPNINISIAFFREEIFRINQTAGVEQNNPHLTPGVEKVDFQLEIIISQAKASWKPAAAAIPLIVQIVGTVEFFIFSIRSAQESKISFGLGESANSLRSWPEQKTGPSPDRTRILVFFCWMLDYTYWREECSYLMVEWDKTFRFLGLVRLRQAALVGWWKVRLTVLVCEKRNLGKDMRMNTK